MVDVAINVYGKPYQTAVTLLSLLRHCEKHINRIYFVLEPKQPRDKEIQIITELIPDKLDVFVPENWLWCNSTDSANIENVGYRHSIRYQFAWEQTDQDFLFITHNDVLYKGDVIGALVENIGDNIGIGQVGQCWNCPASAARLCGGDKYLDFRPSYEEVIDLYIAHPSQRQVDFRDWVNKEKPWPLPECRLNEWVALIDMRLARPITKPLGSAQPFGAFGLDIGTQWFSDVLNMGYRVKNFDFEHVAKHAWTTEIFGHASMFDDSLYDRSETIAKELLHTDFNIDPEILNKATKRDTVWQKRIRKFKKLLRRR
jgi:hypothetical protein